MSMNNFAGLMSMAERMEVGRNNGLGLRQIAVLEQIVRCGITVPRIRTVAAALSLSKPVVTRAVSALENYGLVRRTPDPRDARDVMIAATPAGIDTYWVLHEAVAGLKMEGRDV